MAPAPEPDFSQLFSAALALLGFDLGAWLRALARVAPSLLLVPAFGGSALPAPARAGLGAALAATIAPALRPVSPSGWPLPLELALEVARGLPIALGAALLVYTALMAGGAMDDLRGGREAGTFPVFEGAATPLGVLLGLLVTLGFFELGGPARLLGALAAPDLASTSLTAIVGQVAAAVGLAVAAAAPVAVAAVVLGVAEALIARAALPANVGQLVSPLRGVALLAVAALVLDGVLAILLAGA